MPGTDLLSVVIPVYRNEGTLEELHALLREELRGLSPPPELLFVVDGSPDESERILTRLAAHDAQLRILCLSTNRGQNWALLAGIRHARGEMIATLDADLQDPPSAILAMLAAMNDGLDVVFAGRRGRYQSVSRLLTSRLFKWGLSRLGGGVIPPDAGLFLLMRRSVASALLETPVSQPYIPAMIARGRFATCSIPILRNSRREGKSAYTLMKRLTLASRAMRIMLGPRNIGRRESTVRARLEELSDERFVEPW